MDGAGRKEEEVPPIAAPQTQVSKKERKRSKSVESRASSLSSEMDTEVHKGARRRSRESKIAEEDSSSVDQRISKAIEEEDAFLDYIRSLPAMSSERVEAYMKSQEAASRTEATGGLEHLENLYRLMEQLGQLKVQNSKLQERVKYLETMAHEEEEEEKHSRSKRSTKCKSSHYGIKQTFMRSRERSRSVGVEEILKSTSQYRLAGEGKSKVSKWTKVKEAFRWEKASNGVLPEAKSQDSGLGTGDDVRFLRVPQAVSDSSSPADSVGQGGGNLLSSSASTSDDDLEDADTGLPACQYRREYLDSKRSKSLDGEVHLMSGMAEQSDVGKDIKNSPTSHKGMKTPWGKMKDIIQTRAGSVKKKKGESDVEDDTKSGVSAGETQPQDLVFPDSETPCDGGCDPGLRRRLAPTLTITLPSTEELRGVAVVSTKPPPSPQTDARTCARDRAEQAPRKVSGGSAGTSPPTPRRLSKWSKVKNAFLTSGAQSEDCLQASHRGSSSVPSSPVKSANFTYDIESDELSSGEFMEDSTRDDDVFPEPSDDMCDVFMKNDNIQAEIQRNYEELQQKLSQEFHKKLCEWERMKSSSPGTPPCTSRVGGSGFSSGTSSVGDDSPHDKGFRRKMEEWEKMKSPGSSKHRESVTLQQLGEENLSPDFKKKLEEWEKIKSTPVPQTPDIVNSQPQFKKKITEWQLWRPGVVSSKSDVGISSIATPPAELPEDFYKKLQEWERLKHGPQDTPETSGNRTPSPGACRRECDKHGKKGADFGFQLRIQKSKSHHEVKELAWLEKELHKIEREKQRLERERDKYLEREARLEKLRKAIGASLKKQEILIPTSTGLFRFEGISQKFTRKLYEWEKARGIGPEASTFALLDPGYQPPSPASGDHSEGGGCGGGGSMLTRSKSVGSVVDMSVVQSSLTHQPSSLSLTHMDQLDSCALTGEGDEPQAVIVDVEDEVVETAAPLAPAPAAQPHTAVYCYAPSEVTRLIDSSGSDSDREARRGVQAQSSIELLQENISLLDRLQRKEDICRELECKIEDVEDKLHTTERIHREHLGTLVSDTDNLGTSFEKEYNMEEIKEKLLELESQKKELLEEEVTLQHSFVEHSEQQALIAQDLVGKVRQLQDNISTQQTATTATTEQTVNVMSRCHFELQHSFVEHSEQQALIAQDLVGKVRQLQDNISTQQTTTTATTEQTVNVMSRCHFELQHSFVEHSEQQALIAQDLVGKVRQLQDNISTQQTTTTATTEQTVNVMSRCHFELQHSFVEHSEQQALIAQDLVGKVRQLQDNISTQQTTTTATTEQTVNVMSRCHFELQHSFVEHSEQQALIAQDLVGKVRQLQDNISTQQTTTTATTEPGQQTDQDIDSITRVHDLTSQLIQLAEQLERAAAERSRELCLLRKAVTSVGASRGPGARKLRPHQHWFSTDSVASVGVQDDFPVRSSEDLAELPVILTSKLQELKTCLGSLTPPAEFKTQPAFSNKRVLNVISPESPEVETTFVFNIRKKSATQILDSQDEVLKTNTSEDEKQIHEIQETRDLNLQPSLQENATSNLTPLEDEASASVDYWEKINEKSHEIRKVEDNSCKTETIVEFTYPLKTYFKEEPREKRFKKKYGQVLPDSDETDSDDKSTKSKALPIRRGSTENIDYENVQENSTVKKYKRNRNNSGLYERRRSRTDSKEENSDEDVGGRGLFDSCTSKKCINYDERYRKSSSKPKSSTRETESGNTSLGVSEEAAKIPADHEIDTNEGSIKPLHSPKCISRRLKKAGKNLKESKNTNDGKCMSYNFCCNAQNEEVVHNQEMTVNVFVPTTRKIFSPVRKDSKGETSSIIGYVVEESLPGGSYDNELPPDQHTSDEQGGVKKNNDDANVNEEKCSDRENAFDNCKKDGIVHHNDLEDISKNYENNDKIQDDEKPKFDFIMPPCWIIKQVRAQSASPALQRRTIRNSLNRENTSDRDNSDKTRPFESKKDSKTEVDKSKIVPSSTRNVSSSNTNNKHKDLSMNIEEKGDNNSLSDIYSLRENCRKNSSSSESVETSRSVRKEGNSIPSSLKLRSEAGFPPISPLTVRREMKVMKETAPSIRMMIAKYNQKVHESQEMSGTKSPDSGTQSPVAWRSPIAERRIKSQMEKYQEEVRKAFQTSSKTDFYPYAVLGQVQKSASAGYIRPFEKECSSESINDRSESKSLSQPSHGILKSSSVGAIKSMSPLPPKRHIITSPNLSAKRESSILSDLQNKPEPTSQNCKSVTEIGDVKLESNPRISDVEPAYSRCEKMKLSHIPPIPTVLFDEGKIINELETSPESTRLRALRIKKAKEEFLQRGCVRDSSQSAPSTPGTPSQTGHRGVPWTDSKSRLSQISCGSESSYENVPMILVSGKDSPRDQEGALLVKSASAGMINVDSSSTSGFSGSQRDQGDQGAIPKSKSGILSRFRKARLKRHKDKDQKLGTVSTLCRQSLVVDINKRNQNGEDSIPSSSKSCPSSPVLHKKDQTNSGSWIRNPRRIFKPK